MSNHHHAPLKVKDLETSFVGGRQTATSTPSGKATNKAPAPASTTVHKLTDYDKALSKLSKNYRGTPYEAALKQLLEEKAKNQGNKRDIDEVPSPEKVSAQMKSVQMGRMVTSAVLDSHLNPALDEKKDKNRINKLAKPNPKNIYVKVREEVVMYAYVTSTDCSHKACALAEAGRFRLNESYRTADVHPTCGVFAPGLSRSSHRIGNKCSSLCSSPCGIEWTPFVVAGPGMQVSGFERRNAVCQEPAPNRPQSRSAPAPTGA